MNANVRNRLIVFGLVWGVALAVFPAIFAFDDPFTVSPFLVSAFVCSALSGVAGAFVAGGWASGRSGVFAVLIAGVLHGVVFCALASLSIWVCLAVNISGFSTATPGNIFNLVGNPGIFEVSGVAAVAVFVYSLVAGMLFSPASGSVLVRVAGGRAVEYDAGKGSV